MADNDQSVSEDADVAKIENQIDKVGSQIEALPNKDGEEWKTALASINANLTKLQQDLTALSEKPAAQSAELMAELQTLRTEIASLRETVASQSARPASGAASE